MIEIILAFIGAIVFWRLVAAGFSLGAKATAATERTAAILEAVLPPEKLEAVRAFEHRREEERAAADLAYRRKRAAVLWVAIIGGLLFYAMNAKAQGIYMGRDGRAHAQVIVGPDGRGWPVAPTFCTPGFGPCPVVLGAPLPPPPLAYAPPPDVPPPPLGWVFGRYTACVESDCGSVVVSVGVDGLNVRAVPNGPVVLALANGVLLFPLRREGDWLLVAAGCPLAPTFTASITAGGIPLSVCS